MALLNLSRSAINRATMGSMGIERIVTRWTVVQGHLERPIDVL
jgi:hypothetical protein